MNASLSRRRLLSGAALLALSAAVTRWATALRLAAGQPATPLGIIPRSEWGADLTPKGPIGAEDVRFLLVHHTQDPGSVYDEGDVAGLLRGIFRYHTASAKGWPDVAYNFFVDRFGRVWEGRTGSLAGPVEGSATGGNQGFSQLCCFVGDHTVEPPSDVARAAMVSLLAWLANRHGIPVGPQAVAEFVSRGSNKHAEGALVTTNTIAGHRDMSQTDCPGNACYSYVVSDFRTLVASRRRDPDVAVHSPEGTVPEDPQPSVAEGSRAEPAHDGLSAEGDTADLDGLAAAAQGGPPTGLVVGGAVAAAAIGAGAAGVGFAHRRHRDRDELMRELREHENSGGSHDRGARGR